MVLVVGMLCNVQVVDLYKVSRNVVLCVLVVFFIIFDFYLFIWLFIDVLNESSIMYWIGMEYFLLGVICVDGKIYCFMGKDKLNFEIFVFMIDIDIWQGSYIFDELVVGWNVFLFNVVGWKEG